MMARVLLCCIVVALLRTDRSVRWYHWLRQSSGYTPLHRRTFEYDRIDPHVWLGRQPRDAQDVHALRHAGIGAILCFTQPWEEYVPPDVYRTYAFERLALPVCDFGAPTAAQVDEGMAFLRRNRTRGVYVHCNAGRGRSGVMAVAYYIATYVDPSLAAAAIATEAIQQVRRRRPALSTLIDYYPITAQARAVRAYATHHRRSAAAHSRGTPRGAAIGANPTILEST